jgi:hypothetical protein
MKSKKGLLFALVGVGAVLGLIVITLVLVFHHKDHPPEPAAQTHQGGKHGKH